MSPYRRNKNTVPSVQPTYNSTLIRKLAGIQRKAAIMITGAMKTTATEALDAMANLFPFHLAIDKIRHQAALRMATLPTTHPLHAIVKRAESQGYVKSYPAPIHEILYTYGIKPRKMEKIVAIRDNNRYRPQVRTQIRLNREAAIKDEERDNAQIRIYTDGSAAEGKVGAAAEIGRASCRERVSSPV